MVFPDTDTAVAAFLSAGATTLAIRNSGQHAVEQTLNDALAPFGVEIDEIPATPQRIRAAIRNAEKTA